MPNPSDLFGSNQSGGFMASVVSLLGNLIDTALEQTLPLSKKERQQNEFAQQMQESSQAFTAEQSAQTMQFNSLEAAKARDFQLYMDSSKYQRSVQDMQAAGLNPALMYGSPISSPSSPAVASSSPVGNSAAPVPTTAPASLNILGGVADFVLKMAQARNLDQDTQNLTFRNEFAEDYFSTELDFLKSSVKLTDANFNVAVSTLDSMDVERACMRVGMNKDEALQSLLIAQAVGQNLDNDMREKLNPLLVKAQELSNDLSAKNIDIASQQYKNMQEEFNLIRAQISEIYSQAVLNASQKGYFDQLSRSVKLNSDLTESTFQQQVDIITQQAEMVTAEANMKKFDEAHQDFNFKFGVGMDIFNGALDVADTVLGFMTYGLSKMNTNSLVGSRSTRNNMMRNEQVLNEAQWRFKNKAYYHNQSHSYYKK